MTLIEYIREVVRAAQEADEALSYRELSRRAGLSHGYVAGIMASDGGGIVKAESLLAAIDAAIPDDPGTEWQRLVDLRSGFAALVPSDCPERSAA